MYILCIENVYEFRRKYVIHNILILYILKLICTFDVYKMYSGGKNNLIIITTKTNPEKRFSKKL